MTDQQTSAHHLASDLLHEMMVDIFLNLGVPPDHCTIKADILWKASLAGYDSHGLIALMLAVGQV